MDSSDETSRAILFLLSEGHTFDQILALHPTLSMRDIFEAAAEGLAALEGASRPGALPPRVPPRAFRRWTPEEDAKLTRLLRAGGDAQAIGHALERNPNAVALRAIHLTGEAPPGILPKARFPVVRPEFPSASQGSE